MSAADSADEAGAASAGAALADGWLAAEEVLEPGGVLKPGTGESAKVALAPPPSNRDPILSAPAVEPVAAVGVATNEDEARALKRELEAALITVYGRTLPLVGKTEGRQPLAFAPGFVVPLVWVSREELEAKVREEAGQLYDTLERRLLDRAPQTVYWLVKAFGDLMKLGASPSSTPPVAGPEGIQPVPKIDSGKDKLARDIERILKILTEDPLRLQNDRGFQLIKPFLFGTRERYVEAMLKENDPRAFLSRTGRTIFVSEQAAVAGDLAHEIAHAYASEAWHDLIEILKHSGSKAASYFNEAMASHFAQPIASAWKAAQERRLRKKLDRVPAGPGYPILVLALASPFLAAVGETAAREAYFHGDLAIPSTGDPREGKLKFGNPAGGGVKEWTWPFG